MATALRLQDRIHLDHPCVVERTVFVDTTGVEPTDFAITPEVRERLYRSGLEAAERWLAGWDRRAAFSQRGASLRDGR